MLATTPAARSRTSTSVAELLKSASPEATLTGILFLARLSDWEHEDLRDPSAVGTVGNPNIDRLGAGVLEAPQAACNGVAGLPALLFLVVLAHDNLRVLSHRGDELAMVLEHPALLVQLDAHERGGHSAAEVG